MGAAGSSMCSLAAQNSDQLPLGKNCNLRESETRERVSLPCDVTWYQFENPLEGSVMQWGAECPTRRQPLYMGTMLREPLSLARSQIDFVKARDWYKSHLACIPQGQAACDEASQN